jgi:hypothetical protein
MSSLQTPKLELSKKSDTVKKFQDFCTGLTIVFVYAILWLLIGALGYNIFLWLF